MGDSAVDLIYLDPPFNSGIDYGAFDDRWRWQDAERDFEELRSSTLGPALEACRLLLGPSDILAYLVMMAPRLIELRRVLRPTGSIYLHCTPHAVHYLKILMDAVFGRENFRNELIWSYGGRGAKAVAHQFGRNHDIILLYSRTPNAAIYRRQYLRRHYSVQDARRRGLRQDGNGRWYKTAPRGDYTDTSIERLEAVGRVHRTRSGAQRIKYFLVEEDGLVVEEVLLGDTWLDIPDAMHLGAERTGYPTQKPLALLERIILAGSDPGALALDPFCGSGTTLVAAESLGRRWIGMDSAAEAISLARARLQVRS